MLGQHPVAERLTAAEDLSHGRNVRVAADNAPTPVHTLAEIDGTAGKYERLPR